MNTTTQEFKINVGDTIRVKAEWRWYYDGIHHPVLFKEGVIVADDCKTTLSIGENEK